MYADLLTIVIQNILCDFFSCEFSPYIQHRVGENPTCRGIELFEYHTTLISLKIITTHLMMLLTKGFII